MLFCHATPRDDEEVVLVDSRPDRWAEVFAGCRPRSGTVVCGHTHMPFTRLVDRRLVVNPGSVGMPYGGAGRGGRCSAPACSCAGPRSTWTPPAPGWRPSPAFPDAAEWADEYLRSRHSDADALAVFGPRDGR